MSRAAEERGRNGVAEQDEMATYKTPRSAATAIRAIERAGGLLTPREIAAEWGVSEQAIADRIARGTFPEPVKVAGRVRLYLRDQVEPLRHA